MISGRGTNETGRLVILRRHARGAVGVLLVCAMFGGQSAGCRDYGRPRTMLADGGGQDGGLAAAAGEPGSSAAGVAGAPKPDVGGMAGALGTASSDVAAGRSSGGLPGTSGSDAGAGQTSGGVPSTSGSAAGGGQTAGEGGQGGQSAGGASSAFCAHARMADGAEPSDHCSVELWNHGVVFYQFVDTADSWSEAERETVRATMALWTSATTSRISFTETHVASAGVKLVKSTARQQPVIGKALGLEVPIDPSDPWWVAHTLGHVIGLPDTHERADRDEYIAFGAGACEPAPGHERINRCETRTVLLAGRPARERAQAMPTGPRSVMSVPSTCAERICDVTTIDGSPIVPISITVADVGAVVALYAGEYGWPELEAVDTAAGWPFAGAGLRLIEGVELVGLPR